MIDHFYINIEMIFLYSNIWYMHERVVFIFEIFRFSTILDLDME